MKQCGQRSQAAAGSVNKKCNPKKSMENTRKKIENKRQNRKQKK